MSSSFSLLAKKNDRKLALRNVLNHVKTAEPSHVVATATRLSSSVNESNSIQQAEDARDIREIVTAEGVRANFSLENSVQRLKGSQFHSSKTENIIPGAILALGAAMACALSAVGALAVIRGPRTEDRTRYLEEMREYHRLSSEEEDTFEDPAADYPLQTSLTRDEIDEIKPEDAV
ncbi:hypothetical protein BWQ96_06861 [Gracilariopsis chorda]|uniref:Uncharacterized protein n=1 Tax=Gracilariopsis chorda TaxID=448386 RepID=A0A2V3IMQ8_9FLOR|nr:hypothetical protein BWQ96_06861 [Gracilariopsis chorda]|eukprot:PXF43366.1 hypothetical protein BWQ96_06861 [Gracilariopsis chorda]